MIETTTLQVGQRDCDSLATGLTAFTVEGSAGPCFIGMCHANNSRWGGGGSFASSGLLVLLLLLLIPLLFVLLHLCGLWTISKGCVAVRSILSHPEDTTQRVGLSGRLLVWRGNFLPVSRCDGQMQQRSWGPIPGFFYFVVFFFFSSGSSSFLSSSSSKFFLGGFFFFFCSRSSPRKPEIKPIV
ncbi:hypothetical protein LX32DRAFT_327791 [Colletotrichum zoysiae]|uniref:Uncharacterized protein n=1 Tax=Colletotrichum zoysiae TaxID=1216348 RepID=A0AAD9M6G4_9PEZI|nr:hypothetical protein LX32DRAFT_327791 [Colletotrichum zoysiae]